LIAFIVVDELLGNYLNKYSLLEKNQVCNELLFHLCLNILGDVVDISGTDLVYAHFCYFCRLVICNEQATSYNFD